MCSVQWSSASPKEANAFLQIPEIWVTACNGEEMPYCSLVNIEFGKYEVSGKIVAICCYNRYKDGWRYHPYMLKAHRAKHFRGFLRRSVQHLSPLYVSPSNERLTKLSKWLGFTEIDGELRL